MPDSRTFGLTVEYDGTDFHGSQLQANARTVQGELEAALGVIFGRPVRVRLASRTDAGVHALGQVAAFEAETRLDTETIRRALNNHLPDDARVRCAQVVSPGFDPRRRALSRSYEYTLTDAPAPPALHRRTQTHVRHSLDARAMDLAARVFVGTHDFAAFAGPATEKGATTTRRVDEASVVRSADTVVFTVRGNAFLHQQVRRMAAQLVEVGRGAMTTEALRELLSLAARDPSMAALGPRGLCLTKVEYGGAGPCGLSGSADSHEVGGETAPIGRG